MLNAYAGGGDPTESITVYHIDIESAAEWLTKRIADGTTVDLKVWAGLGAVRMRELGG